MKRLTIILSLIAMMFCIVPIKVEADVRTTKGTKYGDITVDESAWTSKPGGGYYITQEYTVTKTNASGYVFIAFTEDLNVKITNVVTDGAFEKVGDFVDTKIDGFNARVYVFKLKSGTSINGATKLATVTADIVDPSNKSCVLNYSPLGTTCTNSYEKYFDDKGKLVTEDEYKAACESGGTPSTNPPDDEPNTPPAENPSGDNPQTGSVIPYIAIGGGLAAIAGVYFISRKSNKMYRI